MNNTSVEYAGFWLRAAAALMDSLLLAVVGGIVHVLVFGSSGIEINFGNDMFSIDTSEGWFDDVFYFAVSIAMWVKFCGTPGKLLLNCYVVDANTGKPITWGKALARYFGYILSLLPLGLGFFWIMWDKRKQGFHDKIAKTIVVRQSPIETDDESRKSLAQLVGEVR